MSGHLDMSTNTFCQIGNTNFNRQKSYCNLSLATGQCVSVCVSVCVPVQGLQCVSLWDTVCVSKHGVRCVSGKTKLTAFSALVASSLCGTTLDNTFLTVSHGESLKQRHFLSFAFHRS